jgi:glutathione S-transferase
MKKIMTKFYNSIVCPFGQRALIALNELNIDFEYVHIDLNNKPSWYVEKINPFGKVPCIQEENQDPIFESLVIIQYLAEKENKLIPKDLNTRAFMRIWTAYFDDNIMKKFYEVLMGYKNRDNETNQKLLNTLTQNLKFFSQKALQKNYKKGSYFLGEDFSLIDISVIPFLMRMEVLFRVYNITEIFKTDDEDVKLLGEYYFNVIQKDSVQQSSYKPKKNVEKDDFDFENYLKESYIGYYDRK